MTCRVSSLGDIRLTKVSHVSIHSPREYGWEFHNVHVVTTVV